MREIIIGETKETICFSDVDENTPIFAKKNGKLCGMVVRDNSWWILRTGGDSFAFGYHPTLFECIKSCSEQGYRFFVA